MSAPEDPSEPRGEEPAHAGLPARARASRRAVTDRTGLLIIRAWVEKGSSEPLRAQVRLVADVSRGLEQTLSFSRSEAVTALVQGWLASILSAAELPD